MNKKVGIIALLVLCGLSLGVYGVFRDRVSIESLHVDTTSFDEGVKLDDFSLDALTLVVTFTDSSTVDVPIEEHMVQDADRHKLLTAGEHEIIIEYEGHTVSIFLKLLEPPSELTLQLMSIHQTGVTDGLIDMDYEEWLESIRGEDGRSVVEAVVNEAGHLIITYCDEEVLDLGRVVGSDGREVVFDVSDTHIRWRYHDETAWEDLIALEALEGPIGKPGEAVEFTLGETHIQWRVQGDADWIDLVELSSLEGVSGQDGIGIVDSEINEYGELIFYYSDGSNANLGPVLRMHTVRFLDYDDTLIDMQLIVHTMDGTLPSDPTREGHRFIGWSELVDNVTEDMNIHALYEPHIHTITFDSRGGSDVGSMQDIEYGQTIVLPVPVKEGYDFAGWYLSSEMNAEPFFESSHVTDDHTLHARWLKTAYYVSFLDYEDTLIHTSYVAYGASAVAPNNPDRLGYRFVGWDADYREVTDNLVVRPLFEVEIYTIHFETGEGSTVETITLPFGTELPDMPEPVLPDYTFEGWALCEDKIEMFTDTTMPYEGATLYALWALEEYTIHLDLGGDAPSQSMTVPYSKTVESLKEPSREGMTFLEWRYQGETVTLPFEYHYKADITFVASWRGEQDGITYETIDGEAVVTGHTGEQTELVIPNTLDGLPVVRIALYAFRESSIEEVTLPASLEVIKGMAFYGSNQLHSVHIEEGSQLRRIDGMAFFICNQLSYFQYENIAHATIVERSAFIGTPFFTNYPDTLIIGHVLMHYVGSETDVVIPVHVKVINANAFSNNTELESVHIHADVEVIGSSAFASTANLSEVTFEEGSILHTIGNSAFSGSGLSTLHIPEGVTHIGDRAFRSTSNLETLHFEADSQLSSISIYTFNGSAIESITIPSSVTSIGIRAFENTPNLTSVTFQGHSQLETIDRFAFQNSAIERMHLSGPIKHIGDFAFRNAVNLESVTFSYGGTLQTIGEDAFMGTPFLDNHEGLLIIGRVLAAYGGDMPESTNLQLPHGITAISPRVFNNQTNLASIHIPATVTEIGMEAFRDTQSLHTVTFADDSALSVIREGTFRNSGIEAIRVPSSVESIETYAFLSTSSLQSLTFQDGAQLKTVGTRAFQNSALPTVHFPASLETIENYAMTSMSSLETVTFDADINLYQLNARIFNQSALTHIEIPASVERINESAFRDATSLHTVRFAPDSKLRVISSNAFMGTESLTHIDLPDSLESIGIQAFMESGLRTVNIPANVMNIRTEAFKGSADLYMVSFDDPYALESVHYQAFADTPYYDNLEGLFILGDLLVTYIGDMPEAYVLDVPDHVTTIGRQAFTGQENLVKVNIHSGVTTIDPDAFSHTPGLTEVVFEAGSSLTVMDTNVFSHSGIERIHIPSSVESIRWAAFRDTAFLESVTFEPFSALHTIEGDAFTNSGIEHIVLPDSVESIGQSAFNNSGLQHMVIPDGVKTIGLGAFRNTHNLRYIYIPSSVTEIDRLAFGFEGSHAVIYMEHDETPEGFAENTWSWNQWNLPVVHGVKNHASTGTIDYVQLADDSLVVLGQTFDNQDGHIDLPSEIDGYHVESIQAHAFYNNTALTSIFIPASIDFIGEHAFKETAIETIYVEVDTIPDTWDETWNPDDIPVVFAASPSD